MSSRRRLKVVAFCGHGMGTVFLMKMLTESVMKELGFEVEVVPANIVTIAGYAMDADLIVTSTHLAESIAHIDKPKVLLDNLVDKEHAKERFVEVLKKLGYL